MDDQYDLVIIGAGAAGLMAAIRACELGAKVLLLEKNRKPGAKILMSGGTRCNLTHDALSRDIVNAFGKNGKFLYSALSKLTPQDLRRLFSTYGVETKVEANGKVFPTSDKAYDVQQALVQTAKHKGCKFEIETAVQSIKQTTSGFNIETLKSNYVTKKLIVATGGKSYPKSGTTGDGYQWLKAFGHTITHLSPCLTPVISNESWLRELQGVSVQNVACKMTIKHDEKCDTETGSKQKRASDHWVHGDVLFTHFGISGPVILDLSRDIALTINKNPDLYENNSTIKDRIKIVFNWLPRLNQQQLIEQLNQYRKLHGDQTLLQLMREYFPKSFASAFLATIPLDPNCKLAEFPKTKQNELMNRLQSHEISIERLMGFHKAEVTCGGVELSEISSKSMESKLVPNLYVVGELLNLDAPVGGYHFQMAFSTGWLAGEMAVQGL